MFRNKINKYLIRAGYTQMNNRWALDKHMAPLSTCRLWFFTWMAILLNLLKSCFKTIKSNSANVVMVNFYSLMLLFLKTGVIIMVTHKQEMEWHNHHAGDIPITLVT